MADRDCGVLRVGCLSFNSYYVNHTLNNWQRSEENCCFFLSLRRRRSFLCVCLLRFRNRPGRRAKKATEEESQTRVLSSQRNLDQWEKDDDKEERFSADLDSLDAFQLMMKLTWNDFTANDDWCVGFNDFYHTLYLNIYLIQTNEQKSVALI